MSRSQDHNPTRKIKSIKDPNEPIGIQIRDLPACCPVPQQAAAPRHASKISEINLNELKKTDWKYLDMAAK
jgi:hypothetical protein